MTELWSKDDGIRDVTSAFKGFSMPTSELIDDLHRRGWTLHKVHVKNEQYVAVGKNPHKETLEATGRTDATAIGNLLVKVMRREFMRSSALKEKLGAWDHRPIEQQLSQIAQAYAGAPVYEPKAAPAWMELAQDCQRRAQTIRMQLAIEYTNDPVPYQTADELREDVTKKRHVTVTRAYAHHAVWSEQQMLDYRLVVDVLGHTVGGGDWGWHGTCLAFAALAPMLAEEPQKALFTELLGQSAFGTFYRQWGPQKICFLEDLIAKEQEKANAPGHTGVHPSQSIVPGALPGIFSRTSMAERSGNPALDAAIAEFMSEHRGELGDIQDYRHPQVAWGQCELVAGECAQFLQSKGFNADVGDGDLNELGYQDAQPSEGVMTPQGPAGEFTYPEHAVVCVYNERGVVWWTIDFTAAQYGYDEFPKVEPGPPGPLIGPQQQNLSHVGSQLDPNANWESGVQPLPDNAYLWQRQEGVDPLDSQGVADALQPLATGVARMHPAMAKQTVVNALRQSLLGTRNNALGHALHYQTVMNIPADVDDPMAYHDALEQAREAHNQARGYAPASHKQYWPEEQQFKQWVKATNPGLDDGDVHRAATTELQHMLAEEEERILAQDQGEQLPAEVVEHEAYEALRKRLKALTKPNVDQKVDFGDHYLYHEAHRQALRFPGDISEAPGLTEDGLVPDTLPPYVYRTMSEEHFQHSMLDGFHQSDGRNNYPAQAAGDPDWVGPANEEGTVAGRWAYPGYLPSRKTPGIHWNQRGRIVKIRTEPEDGWEKHPDDEEGGYWRTFKPIPTERFHGWTAPLSLEDILEGKASPLAPEFHKDPDDDRHYWRGSHKRVATHHADMYPPYLTSRMRPLAQISRHADELAEAAREDLASHKGHGHHFRAAALNLGIPQVGPRQISNAWLHLAPQTSQLGVIDPHIMEVLGHDYLTDASNRDYFKHERELAAGRDAAGYGHMPLGPFSAGLWDLKAGGPGWHPDRAPFKAHAPASHTTTDWNAQTPMQPAWTEPYWWASTQQARDQAGQDFDRNVATEFSRDEVPFQRTAAAHELTPPGFAPREEGRPWKGLKLDDGRIYTWRTDARMGPNARPHHLHGLEALGLANEDRVETGLGTPPFGGPDQDLEMLRRSSSADDYMEGHSGESNWGGPGENYQGQPPGEKPIYVEVPYRNSFTGLRDVYRGPIMKIIPYTKRGEELHSLVINPMTTITVRPGEYTVIPTDDLQGAPEVGPDRPEHFSSTGASPWVTDPRTGQRFSGPPGASLMQHIKQTFGHPDVHTVWGQDYEVGKSPAGTVARVAAKLDPRVQAVLDQYEALNPEVRTCDGGAAVLHDMLTRAGVDANLRCGQYWHPDVASRTETLGGTEEDNELLDEHHHWVETGPYLIDPNGEARGEPRIQLARDAQRYEARDNPESSGDRSFMSWSPLWNDRYQDIATLAEAPWMETDPTVQAYRRGGQAVE